MSAVNLKDFDLAILHFDEHCLHPARADGVVGLSWGECFRWLKENLNLPMVAVCHGPPPFLSEFNDPLDERIDDEERLAIVEYLGDVPVVLNSKQAMVQWGFRRSQVILQGFDPCEFPLSNSGSGILSLSASALAQLPAYRGKALYDAVVARLNPDYAPRPLVVVEPDAKLRGNDYAYAKFRNYVDAVGRRAVYFNPTRRSPMPRSRGEAMMCGLVSVSANNHDVDSFIDHGYNGFFSDDANEIADILQQLSHDPAWCRKVGLRSRETACEVFGIARYLSEWSQLVERCLHRQIDGVLRGD
jgi:glycosyltransferase involved in cell wall biosynthesis